MTRIPVKQPAEVPQLVSVVVTYTGPSAANDAGPEEVRAARGIFVLDVGGLSPDEAGLVCGHRIGTFLTGALQALDAAAEAYNAAHPVAQTPEEGAEGADTPEEGEKEVEFQA